MANLSVRPIIFLYNPLTIADGIKEGISNVNFEDEECWKSLEDKNSENHKYIFDVLLHLAICHSVVVDERKGKYNASSPDELALVNAAKYFGVVFEKRDEEDNILLTVFGKKV